MNNNSKPAAWLRLVITALLTLGVFCPQQALAQVPARFYLKSLAGANAVPLIYESISGNTNPFDPSHTVNLGADTADFDAEMALAGYALTFPVFNRAAMAAFLVPMGRISGEGTLNGSTLFKESASGFGDPMIEFNINILGPPPQRRMSLCERSSGYSGGGSLWRRLSSAVLFRPMLKRTRRRSWPRSWRTPSLR